MAMNINPNLPVDPAKVQVNAENLNETNEVAEEQDGLFVGDAAENANGQDNQTGTIAALEAQKQQLQQEKALNEAKIKKLDEQIQKMAEQIEKDITVAMEELKEITEDQIKKTNDVVSDLLKKLEEGTIDRAQFDAQLQAGLNVAGVDAQVANQLAKIINANDRVSVIELLANEIGDLTRKNQDIDAQIRVCDQQIASQRAAAAAAAAKAAKCDPIGFEFDGVKYDFFIDKDNNGDLSNEKEFLGANDGWAEVERLDTDKDGKVADNELASLMVVVTKQGGDQAVIPAMKLFEQGDSIDLGSYKKAETQSLEGTGITNNILGTDVNGVNRNELVGTFGLTFKGVGLSTGYQTLDDVTWLKENYNFSDNKDMKNKETNLAYKEKIDALRAMVASAMEQLGFSKEMITKMTEMSYNVAKVSAEQIEMEAEAEAKAELQEKEAEEAKKEDEEKAAEEQEAVNEATEKAIEKATEEAIAEGAGGNANAGIVNPENLKNPNNPFKKMEEQQNN